MKRLFWGCFLLVAAISTAIFAQVTVYRGGESQYETDLKVRISNLSVISTSNLGNLNLTDLEYYKKECSNLFDEIKRAPDLEEKNRLVYSKDVLSIYRNFLTWANNYAMKQASYNRQKAEEIRKFTEEYNKRLRDFEVKNSRLK